MVLLVEDSRAQWAELDRRIAAFDAEFVRWAKENEEARRLTTIPGFGPIVASALVAAVGRAESFNHGRDLAAWLGLVPRQFTSGGKPKLLGISKRGNKYLRKQLIHGARAALPHIAERDTPLGRWAKELMRRAHRNVAVVAFGSPALRSHSNSGGIDEWICCHFWVSGRAACGEAARWAKFGECISKALKVGSAGLAGGLARPTHSPIRPKHVDEATGVQHLAR